MTTKTTKKCSACGGVGEQQISGHDMREVCVICNGLGETNDSQTTKIITGDKARKKFESIEWEVIKGTNIDAIREAHPEWTEEECRAEQSKAAIAGMEEALRRNTQ